MSKLKLPRIGGYQLLEKIGGGGFSSVYRACNLEEQQTVACKVVTLTLETTAVERKMLDKEIRVHSAMKHVNILEFLHVFIIEPEKASTTRPSKYAPGIYMLLEFAAGGDLFDKIVPDIGLEEDIAQFYFNQLVAGLGYIHNQGVCHRDLKPENLLLDSAGKLKISDFGLCSIFRHRESGKVRLLTERCGSMPYVAPELVGENPYEAEPIDVWGVGVILFTLLAGNTPWDEPSGSSAEFCAYVNGEIFHEVPWDRLSRDALSLIKGLLAIDPRERFTLADASAHRWCMRPSQIANASTTVLAERLMQTSCANGDADMIDPGFAPENSNGTDQDGDVMMGTNYQTQFTQTLMLFSQTQSGLRYTPSLTRFFSSAKPLPLMHLITSALTALGVKTKLADPQTNPDSGSERLRLRIGGFDARQQVFKGWVEAEVFTYRGDEGSFCVMQRDQGNPISWRQLWKALVTHPMVEGYVLKRR